jgi:hypothetical protein
MPAPAIFYREKLLEYSNQLSKKSKLSSYLGILRLLVFVAFLLCMYGWFAGWQQVLLISAGVSLTIFIILVRISISVKEKINWLDKLHFINGNETAILNGLPNEFADGAELYEAGSYAADLDIFGPNSLYHLLNRTTTTHGSTMLAHHLKHPLMSAMQICGRQRAVQVLSEQPETLQAVIAAGLIGNEEKGNLTSIFEWLNLKPVVTKKKWTSLVCIVLPIFNTGFLLYYLSTDNYLPLIAGISASWCITAIYARYMTQQHVLVARRTEILQQYAGILKHFSSVKTSDADELEQLVQATRLAGRSINQLSKLSALFDQRLNILVYIFLNSFLLYDIQLARLVEQWKEKHREKFPKWIDCVGKIEMLTSLAGFRFNNPQFIFPVPVTGKQRILAKGVCHPLIPERERVGNPLNAGNPETLFLITGSNMSGKTTYLRTVGVSLLLAQCGAPVCAETFDFTPMQLLTSIRVNDSLLDHTSYFMAELKQLRLIIDNLETGIPALVLVDEILRGTNSEDKNHGSEAFIRKLIQYNALCLFATHDLSLGKLEQALPNQVKNVCFESSLKEGELIFDYSLREGVAKNRNATFLMQKMGII